MNTYVNRPCSECGVTMVSCWQWSQLNREQRDHFRGRGLAAHQGRGLCRTCHGRDWYARNVAPHTSDVETVPAEVVVEEWTHLANTRRTDRENVAHIAPILGMTETALERALARARARGLLERAA